MQSIRDSVQPGWWVSAVCGRAQSAAAEQPMNYSAVYKDVRRVVAKRSTMTLCAKC
jgi:hypothetical protein